MSAAGVTKSVASWGVDTSWPNFDNVRLNLANMGAANVDSFRMTFHPGQALIDNGNGTYSLNATARTYADNQLNLMLQGGAAGSRSITMMPGEFGSTFDYTNWFRTIKATEAYIHSKTAWTNVKIEAVEVFNEPDFWPGEGTPTDFNNLINQLKAEPAFANTKFLGGSTLNSNNAQYWYDRIPAANQGSSHLLGGSMSSYLAFMDYVRNQGKTFVNPELHSLGEAIVGAEHGMVSGTFWGDVYRARGLFVQGSDGKRLGYYEDAGRQSAAAVYRGPDGKVRAYAGGLERFGSMTSYRFVSDADVFVNGIPVREYVLQTDYDKYPSATDNDFANYGSASHEGAYADIETTRTLQALDGYRWKIVNVMTGQVMEVSGSGTADGALIRNANDTSGLNQLWNISRTRNGYYELYNANSGRTAEVANGSLSNSASVRQWGTADNTIQQWYIEDAGNGAFYLRNAFTTKFLTGSATNNFQYDLVPTSNLQKWRFVLANPSGSAKARYTFQNNTNDVSGNARHATAFNGPTYTSGPNTGAPAAIALDGANDYVQLPANVLGTSENLTISTWVKWNGGGNWQRIFDFGSDTSHYLYLSPKSGAGTMRFAINKGEGEQILETAALPTGQWVHLALTLGGNTGILYINGQPQVAGQIVLDPTDFTTSLNYIGKSQFNDPTFGGAIADFRIYDYALHLSQVPSLIKRCWTGQAGADWTTATVASPKNWLFDLSAADYTNGVDVQFNDYATNFTVNIADTAVTPTSVEFTNALNNYTLNGTGAIAGSTKLTKTGAGTLTINNANTYTGGTVLSGGRLNLNHASAIGSGGLTINAGVTIDNTSGAPVTLSTNPGQLWNGDFTFGGTNDLNTGTGAVTMMGNRTVTTNGAATLTIGPLFQSGGARSLTKAGTGTLVLGGTSTYSGGTTILGGTLVVTNAAQVPFLGTSAPGADLRAGTLVFDYTGGSTPATTVQAILDAGFDQSTKFSAGRLRDTTLPAGQLLGWVDDATAQRVTIRATVAGDANLDLVVNFDDLLALAQHYGATSGGTWMGGDFNYDASVNFDDLLVLSQNYGGPPAAFAADWAVAQALVPEPTSLAAMVLTTLLTPRRNRRLR